MCRSISASYLRSTARESRQAGVGGKLDDPPILVRELIRQYLHITIFAPAHLHKGGESIGDAEMIAEIGSFKKDTRFALLRYVREEYFIVSFDRTDSFGNERRVQNERQRLCSSHEHIAILT